MDLSDHFIYNTNSLEYFIEDIDDLDKNSFDQNLLKISIAVKNVLFTDSILAINLINLLMENEDFVQQFPLNNTIVTDANNLMEITFKRFQ